MYRWSYAAVLSIAFFLLDPMNIYAQENGYEYPASSPQEEAVTNSVCEELREAARSEIASASSEASPKDTTFTSGALGLQALNPEISVTGDILWSYRDGREVEKASDFFLRGLGVHLQSYLDPYTQFKAAISANEEETEFEEGYLTRFGVLPGLNLSLGKFRQQFGVVNRWHKHGLDQVDFPLPLRMIFGEGGLNQTGISLDWEIPAFIGLTQELTVQITDGENPRVFGQNANNFPAFLAHLKNYRELSESTYAELGLSALAGRNDSWQIEEAEQDTSSSTSAPREEDLWASVVGLDLTVLWEPTDRMRYRDVTWRSEVYIANKDILAPDGTGEDTISAWGAYSYLQSKVSRTLCIGLRGDYFSPDTKPYASIPPEILSPIAVTESDAYRWVLAPYLTWEQSPFVHFRAEYNHVDGKGTGSREDIFWLQCIFAAGPHRHERY